jgi:hypothetical protein
MYYSRTDDDDAIRNMEESDLTKVFELLAANWARAHTDRRYHDALVTGIVGYLVFREMKLQGFDTEALTWIQSTIADSLTAERDAAASSGSEPPCSFCGRTRPEVRIAAGANGFICNLCVDALNRVLNP